MNRLVWGINANIASVLLIWFGTHDVAVLSFYAAFAASGWLTVLVYTETTGYLRTRWGIVCRTCGKKSGVACNLCGRTK